MSTPLRKPEPEPSGSLYVTTPAPREIRMERVFDAPRDLVWRAHTEPELLAQWWGRGNKLDIERFEPERGGHWRFVEHGPEGDSGFEGRFREVTPQERLVQTFEWDGMPGYVVVNTATFEDLGDGRTQDRHDVALPHHRGARRHARVGHGGRPEPELRGARPAAGRAALERETTVTAGGTSLRSLRPSRLPALSTPVAAVAKSGAGPGRHQMIGVCPGAGGRRSDMSREPLRKDPAADSEGWTCVFSWQC